MESDCSYLDYSFIDLQNSELLLTTSQFAKVIFHDIKDKYLLNEPLLCKYSVTNTFETHTDDRIVLYRLGWQKVTDYEAFEWVVTGTETVKFPVENLPTDPNEFYQLCYLTTDNAVYGASIPFQFANGSNDSQPITNEVTKEPVPIQIPMMPASLSTTELIEENKALRAGLEEMRTAFIKCNSELNELRSEVNELKLFLSTTQNDVNTLRTYVLRNNHEMVDKKVNDQFDDDDDDYYYLGELDPLPPFPILL